MIISHLHSRVHPLPIFDTPNKKFFIKRDDELPHGGSKARKYQTLLKAVLDSGHKKAYLKGGKRSNHIFYFSKLLKEHGIEIALEGFQVEEGGSQPEAIRGALTLATDIHRNEQELGICFDHAIIDAGSGMMGASLLKGLSCKTHILLLAPLDFRKKYEEWFGPFPIERCQLHLPSKWKSFGSFTKPLLRFIDDFTHQTGLPLDPIYSGKLFYFLPEITEHIQGNILIVHQGVSPFFSHDERAPLIA